MTTLSNEVSDPENAEHAFTVEPHTGAGAKKSKKAKAPKKVTRKLALTAAENQQLAQLRKTCAAAGVVVSKQLLLRAAIGLLATQPLASLALQQQALAPVKRKKAGK